MTLEQAHQFFGDGQQPVASVPFDTVSPRMLADAMPFLVWSAKADGGVDYFNARWYEMTALRPGEGGEDWWQALLHPDDVAGSLEAWQQAVRAGERWEMEFRLHDRRSGEYRWHRWHAVPRPTLTGRVERWFGTCADIHEQKVASGLLETQIEELRVLNCRKDEFLAMLVHEIRNPLSSIANAGVLLRAGDAGERGWSIDIIDRQTRQLTRLIDDLLDLVRIGTGKIQLRKATLDLADVLDRAVETTRQVVRENRHELILSYPHGGLLLEADADRVEQIFVNLLTNAAKYTPAGGHISLRAQRCDDQVEVIIRDDGVGIAPESLPAVFDLFTQGKRPATRAKDGVGLGLPIVRNLCALHGGTISAHSDGLGKGTQFTVRLPAGDGSNPRANL